MTKEEKIKEAWGVYYNMFHKYIKKDGTLSEMHLTNNQCNIFYNDENIEVVEKGSDYWYYRPKSLQGIEDNNGWISLLNNEEEFYDYGEVELFNINTREYYICTDRHEPIELDSFTHFKPFERSKYPLF